MAVAVAVAVAAAAAAVAAAAAAVAVGAGIVVVVWVRLHNVNQPQCIKRLNSIDASDASIVLTGIASDNNKQRTQWRRVERIQRRRRGTTTTSMYIVACTSTTASIHT